jgi:hypothetical protein
MSDTVDFSSNCTDSNNNPDLIGSRNSNPSFPLLFFIFPFMKHKLFLFLLLTTQFASAQSPLVNTSKSLYKQNQHNIISEFQNFLAIPNVARDTVNMQKNAAFIMEMMRKRGIQNVQLLDAKRSRFHPQYMEK